MYFLGNKYQASQGISYFSSAKEKWEYNVSFWYKAALLLRIPLLSIKIPKAMSESISCNPRTRSKPLFSHPHTDAISFVFSHSEATTTPAAAISIYYWTNVEVLKTCMDDALSNLVRSGLWED